MFYKKSSVLFFCLLIVIALGYNTLAKNNQLEFPRVREAKKNTDHFCKKLFRDQNLTFPNNNIFIRIFKHEKVLELWAKDQQKSTYKKIVDIPICAASGKLGPKRQQGDRQVPEGFYYINNFNPSSQYHLSMQINYPNKLDLAKTTNPADPGNLIFIHGECASIGCVAVENEPIEALYWIAAEAKAAGQNRIPVHIFPCHMSSLRYKIKTYLERDQPALLSFWENLKTGFDYFETHKQLPKISVNSKEEYLIQ